MQGQKLIFLAEDDSDDRDFFKNALAATHRDHELVIFEDGAALLEHINQYRSLRPDIIILDLNMPRKDGRQCVCELRAHTELQHTPIIVCSTSSWRKDIDELYEMGADLFVVKPSTYRGLVQLVAQIVEIDWSSHEKSLLFRVG